VCLLNPPIRWNNYIAPFDSPLSILTASKRGLEQYSDKFTTTDELFSKTGMELREQVGMTIKESKYLLRILEKYRYVSLSRDSISFFFPK